MPKLLKVMRTADHVLYRQEFAGNEIHFPAAKVGDPARTIQGTQEQETTAHEAPLKSFDKALQALVDVVTSVMELPKSYADGLEIVGVAFSYTKHGIRSAEVYFTKNLDILDGGPHKFRSPVFQFDDGATAEEGRRACSAKHAELLQKVVDETERYANGERQQKLLNFDSKQEPDATDNPEPAQGELIPIGKGAKTA